LLNRIALGLGLISAFSIGLATVLCFFGLLLVRARGLVHDFGPFATRTQRFLPLGAPLLRRYWLPALSPTHCSPTSGTPPQTELTPHSLLDGKAAGHFRGGVNVLIRAGC
jgi:hypothetical protein